MKHVPQSKIRIFTHHKCASSWQGHYLKALAALNNLSFGATSNAWNKKPENKDIALFANAWYPACSDYCGLHVIRNPLMIVLSAYYSHLKTHSTDNWPQLLVQRRLLNKCDFETGLFYTIEFLESKEFFQDTPGPLHAISAWDFEDERFKTVRMEDFVRTPQQILSDTFQLKSKFPSEEAFRFERLSGGRAPGNNSNDSHYRSGNPHEWITLPKPVLETMQFRYKSLLKCFYPEADLKM